MSAKPKQSTELNGRSNPLENQRFSLRRRLMLQHWPVYILVILTALPELQVPAAPNLPNLANLWGIVLLLVVIVRDLLLRRRTNILIRPVLTFCPFLLVALISLTQAIDIQYSVTEYIKLLIQIAVYVVLLPTLLRTQVVIVRTMMILIWVGIVFSIYGWYAKQSVNLAYVPSHPWMGLDISATGISSYLAVATPISFCWMFAAQAAEKRFAIIITIFLTLTLLATLTRSSLLSLVLSLLPMFWLRYGNRLTPNRLFLIFISMTMVALIGLLFYTNIVLSGRDQIIVSSGQSSLVSSNYERNTLWQIAIDAFTQNPLLGTGMGNFRSFSAQYTFLAYNYDAHGLTQKLIAETGILGLLTFYFFIFGIVTKVWRIAKYFPKENWFATAVFVALLSSLIHNQFGTRYFFPLFWFIIGLAITTSWRKSVYYENSYFYN